MPENQEVVEEVSRKRAPSKQAIVAEEAPEKVAEKRPVSFCLLTCNKFTQGLSRGVVITGSNSIVTIRPDDPSYDRKVDWMRSNPANKKNGGTKFVELTDDMPAEKGGCLLDSLLDLSHGSLLEVVEGNDAEHARMTRGALMTKIMKQKGVL
jgi:hypothetical protein